MKNFLLLLFLVVSVPATGAVIHVPGDKTNIQEAIDYAADGDSILVTSGTYSGEGNRDIDFSGKAITVSASSGTVVIDCEGLGRGFVFQSGEGQSSVLENIEIINGSASFGGGIFILNSSPVLSKVTISDCNVGSFGGGAYLSNSSSSIEDMHITRCSSVSGGGIYCTECLDMGLVFKNCQITDCSGSTNGGGLYIENSRLKLQGLSILRNNVDSYGGGLFLSNQADIESDACRIVSNYAWGGAGIYCFESNPLISNSFIYDNTAGFVAGGMQFIDSSAKVINCTLSSSYLTADLSQNAYIGFAHNLARYLQHELPEPDELSGEDKAVKLGSEKVFTKASHPNNTNTKDLLQKKQRDLQAIVNNNSIECTNRTINAVLRKSIWNHFTTKYMATIKNTAVAKMEGKITIHEMLNI
jgi:hypothetical protein